MDERKPRVPMSVLDSLYQAALDGKAADQVMLIRPITMLHMIDEIRHKRAVEAREEHLCDVTYSAHIERALDGWDTTRDSHGFDPHPDSVELRAQMNRSKTP